jgi:hypothetical protein
MDNNQPIGILTQALAASIWKEIHHLLPMKKPYTLQTVRMRLMAKKSKEEL